MSMKAFIPAAGKGTRLRPFTDFHPKALVEVGGEPMLKRVIDRLTAEGFDDLTINIHHFGSQIAEYLREHPREGVAYNISDETAELLDTGGALLHARRFLEAGGTPFLTHNVDILSDASLAELYDAHCRSGADVTLLVSERESSRGLVFDREGRLKAWHHRGENRYIPEDYSVEDGDRDLAFSGIHVMSPTVFGEMERQGRRGAFSVIDFLTSSIGHLKIQSHIVKDLRLIDIGKPETLSRADEIMRDGGCGPLCWR